MSSNHFGQMNMMYRLKRTQWFFILCADQRRETVLAVFLSFFTVSSCEIQKISFFGRRHLWRTRYDFSWIRCLVWFFCFSWSGFTIVWYDFFFTKLPNKITFCCKITVFCGIQTWKSFQVHNKLFNQAVLCFCSKQHVVNQVITSSYQIMKHSEMSIFVLRSFPVSFNTYERHVVVCKLDEWLGPIKFIREPIYRAGCFERTPPAPQQTKRKVFVWSIFPKHLFGCSICAVCTWAHRQKTIELNGFVVLAHFLPLWILLWRQLV